MILRTPVERVVSPVLPVRSLEEVGGSTPVETPKFCITPESQPEGATWQPMTGPRGTSNKNDCHLSNTGSSTCLPCTNRTLSACHCTCHVSLLTSSCATCHPYSGDTCHPLTGPITCCMPLSPTMCHLQMLPHHLYCTACTVSLPRGLYGLYSHPFFLPVWVFDQNAISFAYGVRLTK
jgi:hypothetical protein